MSSSISRPRAPSRSTAGASARQRLLDAAGPIFAERGFEGVTVRDLAAEARVNVAAVGYHFGDKLGLYRAVIDLVQEQREECFLQSDTAQDPVVRFTQLVRALLSQMKASTDSSWEIQLLLREIQRPTPIFEHMVRVILRPRFDYLIATLRELSEVELTSEDYDQLAFGIVGQCSFFVLNAKMVNFLIPSNHAQTVDLDRVTTHMVATTLTTLESGTVLDFKMKIKSILSESIDSR